MRGANKVRYDGREQRRVGGCLGVGCGLSLLGCLILFLLYLRGTAVPTIVVPSPPIPAHNAYDDFIKAAQLASNVQHQTPYNMIGPPALTRTPASFAAAAKDAQPAMSALRAGLSKPCQVPAIRSLHDTSIQRYASLRNLTRELAAVAIHQEHTGQYANAVQTRLDGVEMGVMLEHNAGVLTCLVAQAIQSISMNGMEPLLVHLTPGELTQVITRIQRIEAKEPNYPDRIREESNQMIASLQEFMRDPKNNLDAFTAARNMLQPNQTTPMTWKDRWLILRYLLTGKEAILRQEQAFYEALAKEAEKPYFGNSRIPIPNDPALQMLGSTVNVFDTDRPRFLQMETLLRLIELEAGLMRYRTVYHRYPDQLAALAPTFLPGIPDDLFGGKVGVPLHYQAQHGGQSYLLYSVGPNLRDDGGKPSDLSRNGTSGDIVAGHLALSRRHP